MSGARELDTDRDQPPETVPPGAVPPAVFPAVGWSPRSVLEHEEFLVRQHEAGALRLFDRGSLPGLRRWRMTWSRDGEPVHAVLALTDLPDRHDAVGVSFAARCDLGWGWPEPSPLVRVGLGQQVLLDSASALPATGSTLISGSEPLDRVVAVLRDRIARIPVLLRHVGEPDPVWAQTFRTTTLGAAAVLGLDDEAAAKLDALVPPDLRIPERGARLVLPSCWAGRMPDVCVGELDEPAWRDLADSALRAARWRDSTPSDDEQWQALFDEPCNDERVAGASGWYPLRDDVDKAELRQRIQGAGDSVAELRNVRSQRANTATELDRELEQARAELADLTRSRRNLARGALRLRAERDEAREALARTSLGAAMRRKHAAQRLVRARAAELRRREEGGSPTAAAPAEVRFGPGVREEVDRLDAERRRRCLRLVDLLGDPDAIPPLLRGTAPGPDPALTFRTSPDRWEFFPDHVLLDHSGRYVLHYLREGGVVHVGYVGPAL
ncbi:hypothetical protein [Saccharopolyspora taberi]